MLVQRNTIGALGVVVLVQESITGALRKLYWYSRILLDDSVSCVATAEYYWSTPVGCVGTGTLGRLF